MVKMTHHGVRCVMEAGSEARQRRVAKESCIRVETHNRGSGWRLGMVPGDIGLHRRFVTEG